MNKNQYKFTGSDESYTFSNLIYPLLNLIEEFKKKKNIKNLVIWCPFDLKENIEIESIKYFKSNYIKVFEEAGHKVISSHIFEDKDFLNYEPNEEYHIIISNPPFKNKRLFFERALKLNKPFCLLSTASWLNDLGVNNIFNDYELQLIIPNRRARFFNQNGIIGNQPSFKSIY